MKKKKKNSARSACELLRRVKGRKKVFHMTSKCRYPPEWVGCVCQGAGRRYQISCFEI
jgi:hypothetical protein